MKDENVVVLLLGEMVTITNINVTDEEDGSGIISLNWECDADVNVEEMNTEVKKFINCALFDAINKKL